MGDSKLYHQDNARNLSGIKFITRIPRTYKEEKSAITEAISADSWIMLDENNKYYEHHVTHFEMQQRWHVIHSRSAKLRATKTVNKQIEKEYKAIDSALMHLRNKEFSCENDAKNALSSLSSKFKYHEIMPSNIIEKKRYEGAGRPKKSGQSFKTIYFITGCIAALFHVRNERLEQHSCYVIATNAQDCDLQSGEVIDAYKNQNASVERGFRFLKDPAFFVSSFFLKKPARIMSLLMIMTLSLLVYSVTQKHLREKLRGNNETLPNQIDEPIQNPTMRWIFQLMEGVDVIYLRVKNKIQKKIMGITEIREKIIRYFYPSVHEIYQIKIIKSEASG